jgi:lysophospholipase
MVIIHGAGEHGGRYDHFAAHVVGRGWNVLAPDARGHGLSQGTPTHVSAFEHYLDDLREILRRNSLDPDRTAIFAHSLGGLITARLMQTSVRPLAAAIVLSSPLLALQIRVPAVKRAVGRMCSWLAPETRFATAIRGEHLTRSDWARKRRDEDPFGRRSVTAGWYFRVLDAACDAWTDASRLTVPLLLQQGDADEVVDAQAAIRWWSAVASPDKLLRILSGHLHELVAEPTWEETSDFLLDWLEQRVPSGRQQPRHEAMPVAAPDSLPDSQKPDVVLKVASPDTAA